LFQQFVGITQNAEILYRKRGAERVNSWAYTVFIACIGPSVKHSRGRDSSVCTDKNKLVIKKMPPHFKLRL